MRKLLAAALVLAAPIAANAQTKMTLTTSDIQQMAGSFMVTDSRTLSPLAAEQYPDRAGQTYNYFSNSTYAESDGDIHCDLTVDGSGTGAHETCCNGGDSPITAEVLNGTGNKPTSDAAHLNSLNSTPTYWEGVFRFRTEHQCSTCTEAGERKFEIHPATRLWKLSGGSYVLDHDYGDSAHLKTVKDGMSHSISTLEYIFTDTWSATLQSDGTHVDFTFPDQAVNYAEFKGTVTAALSSDGLSKYFVFHPTDGVTNTRGATSPMKPPVPSSLDPVVRIIPGSLADKEIAALPGGTLPAGTVLNVNSLTRIDMADIQTRVGALAPGQSVSNVPLKVELIALDLKNITMP